MEYQALYRKWRPKTFDDVVGQQHVTSTIKNEIKNNACGHQAPQAFWFLLGWTFQRNHSGPRSSLPPRNSLTSHFPIAFAIRLTHVQKAASRNCSSRPSGLSISQQSTTSRVTVWPPLRKMLKKENATFSPPWRLCRRVIIAKQKPGAALEAVLRLLSCFRW